MARLTAACGTSVPPTVLDLDALAHAISVNGVDCHRDQVRLLVSAAVDAGVSATLVGTLCDTSQPEAPRQRAFARVASALPTGWSRSGGQAAALATAAPGALVPALV